MRLLSFLILFCVALSGCITINVENPMPQHDDGSQSDNTVVEEAQTAESVRTAHTKNDINYTELGAEYLLDGEFEKAKDCFQKVLDANPNDFEALLGLATAELRLGDSKSAIEHAKKAVKIKDDSFEAWYVLMGAYMADENWNGAWVASDMAYKYAPDDKKEEIKNIQVFILKKMG